MNRDKIISIRVNSSIFQEFLSVVDSKTDKFTCRGGRNAYFYRDDTVASYEKFSPADLFERAMQAYIKKYGFKA